MSNSVGQIGKATAKRLEQRRLEPTVPALQDKCFIN